MIGHDHPFVEGGLREVFGDCTPAAGGHAPRIVVCHAPIDKGAEAFPALSGIDRDEVRAPGRIIVPRQTDGAPVMYGRIIAGVARGCHRFPPSTLAISASVRL